jgi:glycosyltransferase involved in cell wall biosynthesis
MAKILLTANTDWYLYNFRILLAEFLRSQGMEVIFVCPNGRFISEVQSRGFRWVQWDVGRNTMTPLGEIISFLKLFKIYQHEKPQIVHQHTIKSVLYGTLAARLTRVLGIVNSITGMGYIFSSSDRRATLMRPFVKLFYRWVLGQRNVRVIFENITDLELFITQNLTSRGQVTLISGVGVDTKKFLPMPEPGEPLVILMASRMLWDKGVGIFVEAVRILHKRQKVRAVLAGEPDIGNPSHIEPQVLQNWQDEGLVEWWGWQADMPSIYAQCHIVAFPTMYGEGVPTVLLEALSCGRAVVATDVPGCQDVVTHGVNGLLVPVRNAEALAEALETLITNDELRRRMGAAGREIAVEQFSISKVNKETLAVYNLATQV